MKNVVTLLAAVLSMMLFVNCTDNSLEEIEKNEKQRELQIEKIQFTDPEDDGHWDDDEETGSI